MGRERDVTGRLVFPRYPLAVLASLLVCGASAAAQSYPERPIRLIVPSAPGG